MAATGSVIGDVANYTAVQKEGVTLHNIPHVKWVHLRDKDAPINIANISGKRMGAQLIGIEYGANGTDIAAAALYVAVGDQPTDEWKVACTLIGSPATATPA